MDSIPPHLARRYLAELVGTFLLVFFGCGVVHSAVLTGSQSGLWQVAIVWGVAVMAAIYVVGAISGAHINPAMTFAFWIWRGFPTKHVLPYIAAQLTGAFLAAAILYVIFGGFLAAREKTLGITRGQAGSEMTAMCYGEYYPNPGRIEAAWTDNSLETHYTLVSEAAAFLAEMLGTFILGLVVFALTDEHNRAAPGAHLAPVFIGLTVAILISVIAPLTQACFNPARDFGPRIFAYLAGWGSIAIPGPNGRGVVTVYILAPILGGILGGGFYDHFLRHHHHTKEHA